MFDLGVKRLLESLPELEALNAPQVRRLLTDAFLDVVAARDLDRPDGGDVEAGSNLRRLATALEIHAVLAPQLGRETRAACAFVAAEALEVHRERVAAGLETDVGESAGFPFDIYEAIESAALYFTAGYDANAAVASRAIRADRVNVEQAEIEATRLGLVWIRAFFELRLPSDPPAVGPPSDALALADRVRWELWRRIATALEAHIRWLRGEPGIQPGVESLRSLASRLQDAERHSDLHHLAALLAEAADAVSLRALRTVPRPATGTELWDGYVERRVQQRPLLWPAAEEYARRALPGPAAHAVVSVPTGAGKSAVAEVAVAQGLSEGWVLYLAPTNALVAQVLRDLHARFDGIADVQVRAFLGGAEYTESAGEAVADIEDRQILVMTPEKCSLALRQAPQAFERLRLFVLDECHLIGDYSSRAVVAELVVAEVLERAPAARALLMSAMVANAAELASWLAVATGAGAVTIDNPWRPTRTVRAVLGIEADGGQQAWEGAAGFLEENPARAKVGFEAPVTLLASLHGAWNTLDPADYSLVQTTLVAPLTAGRRPGDGAPIPIRTGYVNPMSGRLTHHLASRDHRVLTFLPKNKHHNFTVARDLEPLQPRPRANARLATISALLDLADYELGAASALRVLLDKAVGVHTSAMLRDEQLASEIAFNDGQAVALFATGTLAQGLNLPATAVVIGGTEVGHEPGVPPAIQEERARAQLLNALGRAGRAYVASRSLGIVIPGRWVVFRPQMSPAVARESASFLEYEDASSEIGSQLVAMVDRALTAEGLPVDQMSDAEQTAFAMLSVSDPDDGRRIIQRSFAAYRTGISDDSERAGRVNSGLREAGVRFTEATGAPHWMASVANAAGVPLPATAALYAAATPRLSNDRPTSAETWLELLVTSIGLMSAALTSQLLPEYPFASTRIAGLFAADASREARASAAEALLATLRGWITGLPITELAGLAISETARGDARRGSGNPIPKMIGILDNGFGFGVSRAAGVFAALSRFGTEEGQAPWESSDAERIEVNRLPLAIRFGCADRGALAWYRWGFRRRRVAHLLATHLPPPDDLPEDDLAGWVRDQRRRLVSGDVPPGLDAEGDRVVAALRTANNVL